MEVFDGLKDKLESMQYNISEIKRLIGITKENRSSKIPREVFELQKETTKYAKEVSNLFKEFSHESDFDEMKIYRSLLSDFLSALSDFSSIQKKIIDSAAHQSDCVDSGRVSEIDDIIISLSPLISNESEIFSEKLSPNSRQVWTTIALLTLSVVIIGGINVLRSYKN